MVNWGAVRAGGVFRFWADEPSLAKVQHLMEQFAIVIVGSGPAGISTALSLQKLAPELASSLLVLEKVRHPRPKLCGGGVSIIADPVMRWLDIGWERLDVPNVPIHTVKLRFEDREVRLHLPYMFRVVRREAFDARLAAIARARGIALREETPLIDLQREADGVILQTSAGSIWAQVIVGADGAKSVVRRRMGLPRQAGLARVSRLLEVVTPAVAEATAAFREHCASFDFSPVPHGVQGYLWDFPSYIQGQPFMNRGVFDSRVLPDRPRSRLLPHLEGHLERHGWSPQACRLEGHPERYYHPRAAYAVPHILLAGDAAGVDPLLGEGIAWALRYGPVVAAEVRQAFATGDFSFSGYEQRLAASAVGRGLTQRFRLARFCYGRSRRFMRWAWPLLWPLSRYLAWRARLGARSTGRGL